MSTITTPSNSPATAPIQPLHNPAQAARVVHPQAPLGNVANQAPGMGAKALLAKKLTRIQNPTYVSPTDNLITPCSQKLSAAKKKHFVKANTKPMAQLVPAAHHETITHDETSILSEGNNLKVDDENPF